MAERSEKEKFSFQRNVAIMGVVLFLGKLAAWYLTNSDAIFSDAMESIVNIVAAFMGLYALYLAAKPQDNDHPYGHGKIEFVTSAVEGALIIFAGIMVIAQAVDSFIHGNKLAKLDYGILILAATAGINFLLGYLSYKKGVKENSLVLQSSGKHLQSDTVSTGGITLSLILVYFTKWFWLDAVVALAFGCYIIVVGYKIIRKSLAGIMDEADPRMLQNLAKLLNDNRKDYWIDIHNTRIQQHGSRLHIDSHVTLPYYHSLRDAHREMEEMIKLIAANTDRKVEFNFHMDDCKPAFSCKICQIKDCAVRQHSMVKKVEWNESNISQPQKHTAEN